MVAVQNPEIRKAADTLYELSVDEKVRAEYEMRQKAWRDKMWQISSARQEGKREKSKEIERVLRKSGSCYHFQF
jgi:hypothetical protein